MTVCNANTAATVLNVSCVARLPNQPPSLTVAPCRLQWALSQLQVTAAASSCGASSTSGASNNTDSAVWVTVGPALTNLQLLTSVDGQYAFYVRAVDSAGAIGWRCVLSQLPHSLGWRVAVVWCRRS